METVDKDLIKGLTAARKAPANFTVVVGSSECVLIVSNTMVSPVKVKQAREQTGGRPLQGSCFMENGTMVFELTGAPPAGLDKKIRTAIKDHANLSLKVEVRAVEKLKPVIEERAGGSESLNGDSGQTTTAPIDLSATFKDRLKVLTPQYRAAGKSAPAQKPALDQLVAQAMTAAKAKDYEQGLKHLDRLETVLKTTKQSAPSADGEAAAFKERLKVLTPQYQAVGKTDARQKPTLDKIITEAMAAAKALNFAAALAQLDQLEAAIKTAARTGAPPGGEVTAFKERLKALTPVYQAAAKTAPELKGDLDKIMAEALAAAKAQNFAAALRCLQRLEAGIQGAKETTAKSTDNAVQFKNRLKAVTPAFQAALKLDAAAKPALEKSLAKVMSDAKARKFEVALLGLNNLELLIKAVQTRAARQQQVPPSTEKAPQTQEVETEEEETANAEIAAEVEGLVKTLRPKLYKALEALRKSAPVEAAQLEAQFAKAMGASQAGNYPIAYDLLTALDAQITTRMRTLKETADIRKAAGPENVAFVASKQEWNQVRASARVAVTKFQQAVLNDPETKADPRYEDSIVPAVTGLGKVLDNFDDRLNTALDEAANLAADEKGPAIKKSLELIAEYRQLVDASEAIAAMDSGVYGSANVGGLLTAALDKMAVRLNKRLKG